MPALIPTRFSGTVTWLGRVADRAVTLRADPLDEVFVGFGGVAGETHGGLTRVSCSRVTSQHPRGTIIRNVRQLTVLGAEDLAEVAARMGLEALDPALLGASVVVSGIPNFTHVPPSSRLQAASGATLVIDMENRPCVWPAKEIEHDIPGHGKAFVAAARGRRGVTAWIEREGVIRLGDVLVLHVPEQPVWAHLAEAVAG